MSRSMSHSGYRRNAKKTHFSIDQNCFSVDEPVRHQEKHQRSHVPVRPRTYFTRSYRMRHGCLKSEGPRFRELLLAGRVCGAKRAHFSYKESWRDAVHPDPERKKLVGERGRRVSKCRLGVDVGEGHSRRVWILEHTSLV